MRFAIGRAIVVALMLSLPCPHPATAKEMVVLSDIHFDPMADKALVDRLASAPPAQWDAILAADDTKMSTYGADTNWKLLRAMLAALKDQPQPDLVLVLGDFLAHRFRGAFDAAASDHSDAAFAAFTAKTMRFLAAELADAFPAAPILPVLGNNDADCGDYALRPSGPFLADTTEIAAGMIGKDANDAVRQSWRALGNYAVPNPAAPDERIVVVNTNFFSPNYKNACGMPSDGNPAQATLTWLRRVLSEAEAAHRKVWLAYHIPPGIDAFSTARHETCPASPVPMFAEPYAGEFHALMARYRDTVAASFAGHTHMDGFRLLGDDGKVFGLVMMSPAVSPIYGQNPAFRRVALEDDGTIADQSVYDLANLSEAARGAAPQWPLEMSFDAAWSLPRFDRASLELLYHRLGNSATTRDRWLDFYAVEGPARITLNPANATIYRCAAGNDRTLDFVHCSCADAAR
jgi:sphingomyelin phosphodiesterase acid-like 3